MLRPKRDDKALLLNLPKTILEAVDIAVREQGVTRSQFLRQAVERNLRHYQEGGKGHLRAHVSARHELGNSFANTCLKPALFRIGFTRMG